MEWILKWNEEGTLPWSDGSNDFALWTFDLGGGEEAVMELLELLKLSTSLNIFDCSCLFVFPGEEVHERDLLRTVA